MSRYFALALALAITWPHVGFAKGKGKKDDAADSDDDDDDKSDDAPKAKPKAKDKDAKDAKAKAKAKAKPADDDDSDDDKAAKDKDKDAKDKDAKAKAKAKPPAKPVDDSDDDKDSSKFGGKKVTGADAVVTDDDSGGGGGDGSDSGSGGGSGEPSLQKQDLTGHDMGPTKKSNAFEQDRFFVDKRDDKKTAQGTLIQGSLTSTSLFYFETSGPYPTGTGAPTGTLGSAASSFPELWTDLRLQTDFRHIAGGSWDARVDGRIRLVDNPGDTENADGTNGTIAVPNHIQSGLTGQNEYELRELWLARNGDRTDVFLGRQFIADLAGVKIDGLRIDYASSQQFTLLGFAGLFPVRGSRSLTTDYKDLSKDYNVTTQTFDPAGKLVTAGGFGAAYRTESAYGSFGGVAEIPIEGEGPRIFATSQGYWRSGSKLDFYHFAVLDLIGSAGLNVTNASLGLNYKPSPQLRLTGSYNRYDTETLNVQANAFFNQPSANTTMVQNQIFISRLASNEARGSISAGLGNLQRFEITVAVSYRERQPFTLYSPDGKTAAAPIPAGSSVEFYGAITDRRSIADLRLGADVIDSFAIGSGDTAYQRADIFAARLYAGHELANGKGEWEADAEYSTSKDTNNTAAAIDPASPTANTGCVAIVDCYGVSNASVITIGGTLYYRINRDWLAVGTLYLSHTTLDSAAATITGAPAQTSDPGITGLNGFFRIAYRF